MKKYMDKFIGNIKINRNLFIFLLGFIIVGIITGALFSIILDTGDKKLVFEYLNSFFSNVSNNKLDYNISFYNSLVFTVGFAILIWLLGVSVIGFFIVLFLLFLKAFILGFTVGSIILNFKLKGFILSIIYVFPHQVINILIIMLLCAYALIVSFKMIRCFCGKLVLDFRNIFSRYMKVLFISVFVLILLCLYEVFIMPKLLNILLTVLK